MCVRTRMCVDMCVCIHPQVVGCVPKRKKKLTKQTLKMQKSQPAA